MSGGVQLMIDGIPLPVTISSDGIEQSYERVAGGTGGARMADGSWVGMERWSRLATTISGRGPLPAALAGLAWPGPFDLACIAPRAVALAAGGALSVTLPGTVRTDAPVFARGMAADGTESYHAHVAVADGVATVTAHPGAVAYSVYYYPLLRVQSVAGVRETWDRFSGTAGWEVQFEEV